MEPKKRQVTYRQFGDLMERLAQTIIMSGREFEFVYGNPRGGLPIAVHLSHRLGLKFRGTWWPANTKKTLLVVDDIVDTGDSMITLKSMWDKASTASLFIKPHAKEGSLPDYYVYETMDWVVFPWEVFEDKPNRKMYEHL